MNSLIFPTSKIVFITLCLTFFCKNVSCQVDKTVQDTIYLYEEEIVYDTMYMINDISFENLSKDEFIDMISRERGVGSIYRSSGRMYLTGQNQVYQLGKTDLQRILTPAEYEQYNKAMRQQFATIPLYIVGAGGVALFAMGLYQFVGSLSLAVNTFDSPHSEIISSKCMGCAAAGFGFLVAGGLVATGCIVPALVMNIKSKSSINRLVANFNNTGNRKIRLSFLPTPCGAGLALQF